MAAVDLSKLLKEKRFLAASFLIAWAAALQKTTKIGGIFNRGGKWHCLQGHMMWVQRQDAFKHKFSNPDAPNMVTEPPADDSLGGEPEKATADAEFR